MPSRFTHRALAQAIPALTDLRDHVLELEDATREELALVEPGYQASARNLVHYLGLRQHDLRDLQRLLSSLGLSSLGRTESHTLAGIDAVLAALHRVADTPMLRPPGFELPVGFSSGPELLDRHTGDLLGAQPANRRVRIMVTMPSVAAEDAELVRELVAAGMDVARINCAHDDAKAWAAMAGHVRRAERDTGRPCRILFDLAGPKLRTGALGRAHQCLKLRAWKDARGEVIKPARVRCLAGAPREGSTDEWVDLPIEGVAVAAAREGDRLVFRDRRGSRRRMKVVGRAEGECFAELRKNAYVEPGLRVWLERQGRTIAQGRIGELPVVAPSLRVSVDDRLELTTERTPPDWPAADGTTRVPTTLGTVLDDLETGESIWFDDGRIGGVIEAVEETLLRVRVTQTVGRSARLRSRKGINLPESKLSAQGLTDKDRKDLESVAPHADLIGLSFVQEAEDVLQLERELHKLGVGHLGMVLKIETRRGFEALPRILLAALRSPPVGVMVARGDLAVELGFERLAEVQEQILWLCEAAHVPVIWATQVLERMAKGGRPSRAEVTDAAMASRAECVMLNKGPSVAAAVGFLNDVLERMQDHQQKKRSMLRRLSVSGGVEVPS